MERKKACSLADICNNFFLNVLNEEASYHTLFCRDSGHFAMV